MNQFRRGGQDTESAKAKEERDEEGGERELGPGKDAEFRESQETMRWQEMKKLQHIQLAVRAKSQGREKMQGIAVIWMCVGGRNRGGTRWVLAASVHGGNKRGCCLHAWVRAARVGAGCKRRCWLQAWVLAASVGAGGKHVMVAASVGAGCNRGCWLQA